jgi:hypothetical protein
MHLRYSAALALVGWHLMLPPTYGVPARDYKQEVQEHPVVRLGDRYIGIRDDAPIDQWEIDSSYDTASECQTVAFRMLKRKPPNGFDSFEGLQTMRYTFAKCIATDDPRLKP